MHFLLSLENWSILKPQSNLLTDLYTLTYTSQPQHLNHWQVVTLYCNTGYLTMARWQQVNSEFPKLMCWKQYKWANVSVWWREMYDMQQKSQSQNQPEMLCGMHSNHSATRHTKLLKYLLDSCQIHIVSQLDVYGAAQPQTCQMAHADPCPSPKASTMDIWASALDHEAMVEDGLEGCI